MNPRQLTPREARIICELTGLHETTVASWAAGLPCHASTHERIVHELVIVDELRTTIDRLWKAEEKRSVTAVCTRMLDMMRRASKPRRDRVSLRRAEAKAKARNAN